MTHATAAPTTVRHGIGLHLLLWVGLPAAGALLGVVLAHVPGWIAVLPWFPNQEQITELAGVIGPTATVVLAVIGALAGGVLALMAHDDVVTVTVGEDTVTIARPGERASFPHGTVTGAFVDTRHLVLLGAGGAEIARERVDLASGKLRSAFLAHGYGWSETDPHAADFARWIDGCSGLSVDAHAILRVRQAALESDDAKDLRELRRALAGHGVAVREDGKRQYWRTAG
ncbi:YqeB family protein [Pseudonocardia sp. HH130630-07]|uniref:YqeB family protein n=1 Tax=Pseudonocardia sp. HH130630-07 TaxID=1690815 RepID=UPI00081500B2|nr:hypothetical protein [Pseudonocardia sp. HH130630-07]ANY06344.1 hypothetical protein AFB00_08615 [Pseudonocardia sp. HH130630-07]